MKLKQFFMGAGRADVFFVGEKRLAQLKAEGRYSCYRNTRATLRKISLFTKGKSLPASNVTVEWVVAFQRFLLHQLVNGHNTTVENLKVLSMLLDESGIKDNPCRKVPISRIPTKRQYLLGEELDRLMSYRLIKDSEQETARDIFYVECRTGLRISDLLCLRWQDYDGSFIRLRMQKTGRFIEIPVVRSVQVILEKYRNLFSAPDMFVFPFLQKEKNSNEDFSLSRAIIYATSRINLHIKKLAQSAGIGKNVSTHVGRHTFATMLVSKGASIYEVKELLGHQDVKVTQIYAHLLDTRKRQLVELLERKD